MDPIRFALHGGITRAVIDGDVNRPSVFIEDFGSLDRGQFEDLIEWGQQWLKENPKKVEGWMNVYGEDWVENYVYSTHEEADKSASKDRIACIPISYHIGQGLSTEEET